MEDVTKKFGSFETPSIIVDVILRDGDAVGRKLKVIDTPGHTPGHISLFSEDERTVIGGGLPDQCQSGRSRTRL